MSLRLRLLTIGALIGGLLLAVTLSRESVARIGGEQTHYFAQAASWLEGRLSVPLASGIAELIPMADPTQGAIAYPPAPALFALPLMAIGIPIEIGARLLSLAAFATLVGLSVILLRRRGASPQITAAVAVALGLGSGIWFLAAIPSSWYLAQLIGVTAGVAALIVGPDRPVRAGILLGIATAARLPVGVGVAVLLVGPLLGRPGAARRLVAMAIGAAPALIGWGALNLARFGSPLDNGYARIPGVHAEPWFADGVSSLTYLPRGIEAMLLRGPGMEGGIPIPDIGGMAIYLIAPLLVLLAAAGRRGRPRAATLVIGVALAGALLPGLTHGSWGFTQIGYRFAYDALPVLLIAIAEYAPRLTLDRRLVVALSVLGVAVNLWAYAALSAGLWSYRGL